MSQNGKGSKPRPYSVSQEVYSNNWNQVFGKNKEQQEQFTNSALEMAKDAFGDITIAERWFNNPSHRLDNNVPAQLVRTREGYERVMNYLNILIHGTYT